MAKACKPLKTNLLYTEALTILAGYQAYQLSVSWAKYTKYSAPMMCR